MKMGKTPRIALILPYFGRWPDWMPAFLTTCATNPDIDWILISDCGEPASLPPNVQYRPSTLEQINQLASDKLGFPVRLARPYKLCDLKPGYGLMFCDLLKDYAFWGHCDLDILWGRLRHFLPNRHLARYDILTSRKNALAGHFCIYRNIETINRLCLEIPAWEAMLNDNATSYMLDEAAFVDLLKNKIQNGTPLRVDWNRDVATSGSDQKPLLYSHETFRWKKGRPVNSAGKRVMLKHWLFRGRPMIWKNGRTFDSYGKERMYLHFHQLKNDFASPCSIPPTERPQQIIIQKTGIC